jgi:hypothetical protein
MQRTRDGIGECIVLMPKRFAMRSVPKEGDASHGSTAAEAAMHDIEMRREASS